MESMEELLVIRQMEGEEIEMHARGKEAVAGSEKVRSQATAAGINIHGSHNAGQGS